MTNKNARGEVTGAITSFIDITERKQAEERLRFVMDSMSQKVFTAKPNGDVDYLNPQWSEFTGRKFEQIRDWGWTGWTQFIHPDDVAENVRVWRRSIDTGEPLQFEHRFRRADGEYRWHISRALPMRDAEGRIVMWIGSTMEVHEQWQTANKLRQLASDLAESDRRQNEFLAMLAHELRNPLAPIRNALQVMRLTGGNGEVVHSESEMMEREVAQMVRLVDDLLDVSRISRGKIELRRERVDLASVVHHAVEACRPAMERAEHDLTITLPQQPVYLHGDPMRLAQVIGNLLNNACKFTDPGGRILLTVEREPPVPPFPKLNGYEVCRRIREQPWGKTMVLIALTRWGQEEDRRHSKDAGFDAHLVKPVDYGALMKLLALPAEQGGCPQSAEA